MLEQPLKSVESYVGTIAEHGEVTLTSKQAKLVARLLSGILLLGAFKVSRIAALFLMEISPPAIYAMLRRSAIPFDKLFWGSLKLVIGLFGVRTVTIAIDDTERERSKGCRALPFVRKAVCKLTGGWIQVQNLLFFVLVTDKVTIPIWFSFHRPSQLSKKQKAICRKNPKRIKEFDPRYRTKVDLACIGLYIVSRMLRRIEDEMGIKLNLRCISADNGFASAQVQQAVVRYFGCQFVSKANPQQKVKYRGNQPRLCDFFKRISAISKTIKIRGKCIALEYKAARVHVSSYGRKVFVVAIRYNNDKAWQYLYGTDLSWTAESIIKAYGLRWLVEVFFEDWKMYDGWGVGALQRSVDGAARGLFLSLLVDLFLLYHQRTDLSLREHGRNELYSAGTVIRYLQAEAIHQAIEGVLEHANPRQKLVEVRELLLEVAEKRLSLKHSQQWDFDGLEPSPSLSLAWRRKNREEEENQRILMQAVKAG